LGIAIPVGKDSLSMKTVWTEGPDRRSVVAPVSLIVTAFAPVADVRRTLTPLLRKDAGATHLLLVDLGRGQSRLGASIFAQVFGQLGDVAPDLDSPALLAGFATALRDLRERGLLLAVVVGCAADCLRKSWVLSCRCRRVTSMPYAAASRASGWARILYTTSVRRLRR
jgi:phosphoribosylformylglycinamidine (FGAM) synthase-like enzyme